MRFSSIDAIMRYPLGEETTRPAVVVDGVEFCYWNLGSGIYVWRSPDRELEIGDLGGGYYGRVRYRVLDQDFSSLRGTMRRCVTIQNMLADGEIAAPSGPGPHA